MKQKIESDSTFSRSGKEPGVEVFHVIDKFTLTCVRDEHLGTFYSGDSYLILYTYKQKATLPDLSYHIYTWIGSKSTEDEWSTLAEYAHFADLYFASTHPMLTREGTNPGLRERVVAIAEQTIELAGIREKCVT